MTLPQDDPAARLRSSLDPAAATYLPPVVLEAQRMDHGATAVIRVAQSTFYQTAALQCFGSFKPIVRVLTADEVRQLLRIAP